MMTNVGKNVQQFGANAGDSNTDLAKVLALGFAEFAILHVTEGTHYVNSDYTVASGKVLVIWPGAVVSIASGKTLTCTGTVIRFVTGGLAGSGTASGSGKLLITTTNA